MRTNAVFAAVCGVGNAMPSVVLTKHENETMAFAARWARLLEPGDCITLEGPLGSGKTCFARGLAMGLGMRAGDVSSPTFTLCQTYGDESHRIRLHHIDAYRLQGGDDLESIGFDEMLADDNAAVVVEWPSIIDGHLPALRIDIAFGHIDETSRELQIDLIGLPVERALRMESMCRQPIRTSAACPTCGTDVDRASEMMPFCSDRCRLADLGNWFSERYSVTRGLQADDFEDS